jgi:general secretion pathway protein D
LGGLIRNESRLSKGGLPVLKDIPVMGNLFSSTIEEAGRTELIVTLTPRVITNPNEAYEISQELRQKIKDAARIDDDYRK